MGRLYNSKIRKTNHKTKREKGSTLDIRGLCYILESTRVIRKSIKDFNNVGRAMTRARKKGVIDASTFVDNTRNIIKEFDDTYLSISAQIDTAVNYMNKLPSIAKKNIPRWYSQPYYVECGWRNNLC